MENTDVQRMVSNARRYLLDQRANSTVQECRYMNLQPAYNEAWSILFAADCLLSDPNQPHYIEILEAARG